MVQVVDVGPVRSRTTFAFDRFHQSVSGKALAVAMSRDGTRIYLGGHSAVWRSDDGGATWTHPERPQPPVNSTIVPGALWRHPSTICICHRTTQTSCWRQRGATGACRRQAASTGRRMARGVGRSCISSRDRAAGSATSAESRARQTILVLFSPPASSTSPRALTAEQRGPR